MSDPKQELQLLVSNMYVRVKQYGHLLAFAGAYEGANAVAAEAREYARRSDALWEAVGHKKDTEFVQNLMTENNELWFCLKELLEDYRKVRPFENDAIRRADELIKGLEEGP